MPFVKIDIKTLSDNFIRKISHKEINVPKALDPVTGKPIDGGTFDPVLGPANEDETCVICHLNMKKCQGHYGNVEFAKPLYNPTLFNDLCKLMRGVCLKCHRLYTSPNTEKIFCLLGIERYKDIRIHSHNSTSKMSKIDLRRQIWAELFSSRKLQCKKCSNITYVLKKGKDLETSISLSKRIIKAKRKDTEVIVTPLLHEPYESPFEESVLYPKHGIILPEIMREHLRSLWRQESDVLIHILPFLNHVNYEYKTDIFVISNMNINSVIHRPMQYVRGSQSESTHTSLFNDLIMKSNCLKTALNDFLEKEDKNDINVPYTERGIKKLKKYFVEVNKMLGYMYDSKSGKNNLPGLRQLIDKKEGLIRESIEAKRTNYCCRSVISPDPTIPCDGVGIPICILKKLSVPEPLNKLNLKEMKERVTNGKDVYPGALQVVRDGRIYALYENRLKIAACLELYLSKGEKVIVNRHPGLGDRMIMNRQPTLHRPSMQGHRIVPIEDSNCRTIRLNYANCKAYNADFDGDEMNGHLVQSIAAQIEASELMGSSKHYATPKDGSPMAGLIQDHVIAGVFLTLQNTFLPEFYFNNVLVKVLGKLPEIRMKPTLYKPQRLWSGKQLISTLIMNILPKDNCKCNIKCKEAKKNNIWSDSNGFDEFSLNIIDGYMCTGLFDKAHIGPSKDGFLSQLRLIYNEDVAIQVLNGLAILLTHILPYASHSARWTDTRLRVKGAEERNELHNEDNITIHGYRPILEINPNMKTEGDVEEFLRSSRLDKSSKFEGKWKEIEMAIKKEMKQFEENVMNIGREHLMNKFPNNFFANMVLTGAKGSDTNVKKMSYTIGQVEVAGSRSELSVNGKTLPYYKCYDANPSARGYIANCYYQSISGLQSFFDAAAGREGLVDTACKTSSSGYLQRNLIKGMEDLVVHYDGTVRNSKANIVQWQYGIDGLDTIKAAALKSPDQMMIFARNYKSFIKKYRIDLNKPLNIDLPNYVKDNIEKALVQLKNEGFRKKRLRENIFQIVQTYLNLAKVSPGEPVGLIGAQSLGEPSTQMTLNTFHNAGQSEMNVTLGIPRLAEILRTSTMNIKTPIMEVKFLNLKKAMSIINNFKKISFKDVLSNDFELNKIDDSNVEIVFNLKKLETINLSFDFVTEAFSKNFILKLDHDLFRMSQAKNVVCRVNDLKRAIDDASDNDVKSGDEDAPPAKKLRRDVEEDESEEEEDNEDDDDDLSSIKTDDEDEENSTKSSCVDNEDKDSDMDCEGLKIETQKKIEIKSNCKCVKDFIELSKSKLVLKVNFNKIYLLKKLVNDLLESCYVKKVPHIEKAFIDEEKQLFICEGFNYKELLKYSDNFDMTTFYTNNILMMCKLFGKFVAQQCLIREVENVFNAYGIEVDRRHLMLVADYLCTTGRVGGFNRHKMRFHPSPIQRTTFETALDSLHTMFINHEVDTFDSPSAAIMFGQKPKLGTNFFKVTKE